MKIRLFSLCANMDMTQRKAEAKIASSLHGFASNELNFEDFQSPADMLSPLAESLKSEDATILAVELKGYNKIKKKLLPAMNFSLVESGKVKAVLSTDASLDEATKQANSLFPENAQLFLSGDGLYSGFAVMSGKKIFIMLPLDDGKLQEMLKDGVVPFLVANSDTASPATAESGVKSQPSTLVRSINLLKEANSKVAVCGNKQSKYIAELGAGVESFDDIFVFTPHVEDRGDIDAVTYAVQLARVSRNLSHTDLGAVISDPFDDENGRGVCIAVTDGDKAIARRFYAEENETDESLIAAASEEMISLLGQNAYGILEENASAQSVTDEEKIADKKHIKIFFIVLAIVLALCVAAGVAFRFLKEKRAEQTTTESTTVFTTESTTEAKEETGLLKGVIDVMLSRSDSETVAKSDEAPEYFVKNGQKLEAKQALALIVQANINTEDDWKEESLKAMVVAVYTDLKYKNNGFDISDVTMANTADVAVKAAVDLVYGDYLSFNNSVAVAPFHRLSAGKTASAETVYGKKIDYLVSVDSATDIKQSIYKSEVRIGYSKMYNMIYKATSSEELPANTADWIKIISHDAAVSKDVGYITQIQAGDTIISGYKFIRYVDTDSLLPSPCFTVTYDENTREFVFTVYGQGSGVGLSQLGAVSMAGNKKTYADILAYYYPGTTLEKGAISLAATTTTTAAAATTTKKASGTSSKTTTKATTTKAPVAESSSPAVQPVVEPVAETSGSATTQATTTTP